MKKMIILSLVISMFLLSGCLNNSKSQDTDSFNHVSNNRDFWGYFPIPSVVTNDNDEQINPIIDCKMRHDMIKSMGSQGGYLLGSGTSEYLYCGSYNGNVAIYTGPGIGQAVTVVVIEDIELWYPDTNEVIIWSWVDGNFYTMDVAYEKGLIDYEDIIPIYKRYQQGRYVDKYFDEN